MDKIFKVCYDVWSFVGFTCLSIYEVYGLYVAWISMDLEISLIIAYNVVSQTIKFIFKRKTQFY